MSFLDRFKAAPDPQEPASPPPFQTGDRVIVSPIAVDAMFLSGKHGEVIGVEFTTDRNDPYGPWIISVLLDGDNMKMAFSSAELTREPEEDFAADTPIPYVVATQTGPDREQVDIPQPRSDSEQIEEIFADKVEADLAELTRKNAS
jgi:hypothetical protein